MPSDVKQRLEITGRRILEVSKNELYVSMRFLEEALSHFEYRMDLSTFYLGTDGANILFHPRFLAERYEFDSVLVNRSYLHMVLHCLFRHIYQKEGLAAAGDSREQTAEKGELWDLASDIAAEYIIDSMDYRAVKKLCPPGREEVYIILGENLKVLTAEGIYHYLIRAGYPYSRLNGMAAEFLVDDHKYWEPGQEGEGGPNTGKEGRDGENDRRENRQGQEWKRISGKVSTNLSTFDRESGRKAGALLEQVAAGSREHYSYREFLKRFAVYGEEMKVDEDSFDYAYYNYGLQHYGNMPLIEPLEYKEVKKIEEFVIAIDTSGSCSGAYVKQFLQETWNILSETESFFKSIVIHIIQCDVQIQSDYIIRDFKDLEAYKKGYETKGYGGTDYRPLFAYVDGLVLAGGLPHLKGLLYFTDGFGVYPGKKPSYETAFLFVKEETEAPSVPAWAHRVILSENFRVTV